eukprot:764771-Hanusia_phi.AAC.1
MVRLSLSMSELVTCSHAAGAASRSSSSLSVRWWSIQQLRVSRGLLLVLLLMSLVPPSPSLPLPLLSHSEFPPPKEYTSKILRGSCSSVFLALTCRAGMYIDLIESIAKCFPPPSHDLSTQRVERLSLTMFSWSAYPTRTPCTSLMLSSRRRCVLARRRRYAGERRSCTTFARSPSSLLESADAPRSFFVAEEECIALRLSKGFGGQETGGTGVCLWEAGLFLSEFIRSNGGLFAGRSVLELGAGNGVAGICLARLEEPPRRIFLTDHSSRALELLEENLRINDVHVHRSHREGARGGDGASEVSPAPWPAIATAVLDWETCQRDFHEPSGTEELSAGGKEDLDALGDVDIILGADVTFDPRLITVCQRRRRSRGSGGDGVFGLAMRTEEEEEEEDDASRMTGPLFRLCSR